MRCLQPVIAFAIIWLACIGPPMPPAFAADMREVYLPASRQWTMHSQGNGRDYEIFVALPEGATPENGYPVIYILDANSMFLTAVETVRSYSRRRDAGASLRAIVVGIGYPEGTDISAARSFDLTPAVNESRSRYPVGGAEGFLDFIESELKPEIERQFVVNRNQQALMGHSLAGMFTLDVLTKRPQAFQTYVGMSASFWFGQHDLSQKVTRFVETHKAHDIPVRVLLTVGEFEQQPRPEYWTQTPERAATMARDLAARGQITHAQRAGMAQIRTAQRVDVPVQQAARAGLWVPGDFIDTQHRGDAGIDLAEHCHPVGQIMAGDDALDDLRGVRPGVVRQMPLIG